MICQGSEINKLAEVYFLIISPLTITTVGGEGHVVGHPAGRPSVVR